MTKYYLNNNGIGIPNKQKKKENTKSGVTYQLNNNGVGVPISTKKDNTSSIKLPNLVKNIVNTNNIKKQIINSVTLPMGVSVKENAKSTASTLGDIGTNILKGVSSIGESLGENIIAGAAQVADWTGHDEWADKTRKRLAGQDEEFNKYKKSHTIGGILETADEKLDKNSMLGDTADTVNQLIGYSAGLAAGGAVLKSAGIASDIPINIGGKTLKMPILAVSGGMNEGLKTAYSKDNVTDAQAWSKALGSGVLEGVTEGLFGMLGVGGTELTDKLALDATKAFKSSIAKTLAKTGVQATGEAVEEFLSYAGNQGLDRLIDKFSSEDSAKFSENWDWNEVGEQMALAFISAGLTQGASNAVFETQLNKTYKDVEKKIGRSLTKEEKENVREQVTANLQPTIEQTSNNINANNESIDALQNQLIALQEKSSKNNSFPETTAINSQIDKIQNQIAELNATNEALIERQKALQSQKQLTAENVINGAVYDQMNQYNPESGISTKNIALPVSNNTNKESIVNDFINSARANNIENDYVSEQIAQISADRRIPVVYDATKFENVPEGQAAFSKQDGVIYLNPNVPDAINQYSHEALHSVTDTENGKEIVQMINRHSEATKGQQYFTEINRIADTYMNIYRKTGNESYNPKNASFRDVIEEEYAAIEFARNINNQEFVDMFVKTKPKLAVRVYNKINDLIKTLTDKEYRQEKKFWNQVKKKFEIAFNKYNVDYKGKTQPANSNDDKRYSTIGSRGAKNLSKNSKEERYKNLYTSLERAKKISNDNISFEKNNKNLKRNTQWFKTKYGDWGTIISDKNSRITKELEPNKTYRLGDILDHKLLYEAYPGIENIKVKTVDNIKATGSFNKVKYLPTNTITDNILLNNNKINTLDFKKTLLHEINHFIERYEKFNKNSRGTNLNVAGLEKYRNNLGEIISNETKILANLTQEQLDSIMLPKQAKENPSYNDIKDALNLSNKLDRRNNNDNKISSNLLYDQEKVAEEANNINSRYNRVEDIEELDNSSFNLPKVTSNLNEYIEDVASRQAKQRIADKKAVKQSILDYLEENNITNPTKDDMMNAFGWYEENDAANEFEDISKAEKLYSEVADELLDKDNKIQGLDNYTKSDVEDMVYDHFEKTMDEYGFDIDDIQGVYLHGSRLRGTARSDSDIDAVVFYIGNESEDYIFNTINDDNNQLIVDGIKVDINPVSIDSMSEIDDYIARSEAYDKEVLKNGIKYSISDTDNQGRTLTKEQQEYFKDSIVRDENGRLKELYHGTPNDFTVFNYDFIGSNGTALGKGFYLTDNLNMAKGFSKNDKEPMKLYANITKPMSLEELTISKDEFKKFVNNIAKNDEYFLYDYGDLNREDYNKVLDYAVNLNYDGETNDVDLIHGILNTSTLGWEEGFRVLNDTLGYDGVIKYYESGIDSADGESNVYVPMFPEQIKNVNNTNPTSNEDIRFSINDKTKNDYINENIEFNNIKVPKQNKKNIPINKEVFGKYKNYKEIFNNERNNFDGNVKVSADVSNITNKYNLNNSQDIKKAAIEIFKTYNNRTVFINNGNKIEVTNEGIRESIQKILDNKEQSSMLKEHLIVFSDLGDIIEHSKLVSQGNEIKEKTQKSHQNNNYWNYYFDGLEINGKKYSLEFEVRSLDRGQNQYRVQRLEQKKEANASSGEFNKKVEILPPYETSASYENDTTELSESQNIRYALDDKNPLVRTNTNVNFPNINKTLNPLEMAGYTKQIASTTPVLPLVNRNIKNDGKSHFAKNIENKVNMLPQESKDVILSDDEIQFYDKITNDEALEQAFDKLNKGGTPEVIRWLNASPENASAIDVAEGWIMLKQYNDMVQASNDQIEKDQNNQQLVNIAKKLRAIGTSAGQTVQAFNILSRMTPEGMVYYAQSELDEAYQQMVKGKTLDWINRHKGDFELTPDETQFIVDTMQDVVYETDEYRKRVGLAKIQKLITDKIPPERGKSLKAWMRISMLFNPKTQVRNIAGNAIIMPVNAFGDLFASYADALVSKTTGVRTVGKTHIKSILRGIRKGAYQSTNDYKLGINTKDMRGNRFETTNGKSFKERTIIGKKLNQIDNLLNYVMDAGDRVFYEAAFENSLRNQMVLNHSDEITNEMLDIAYEEALSRTWNDNNEYTKYVLNCRNGLNKIAHFGSYGLGDILIPFAKTPANLTKAIVDYSPVGLSKAIIKGAKIKNSVRTGQFTVSQQHQFAQALGKGLAGTMLYILGYALANAGKISGENDDDKDTSNFLQRTLGISSYSIKIGDKTFTYDWAQPIAAPFSIMTNIYKRKDDSTALLEGITASLNSAGAILLEQSFLQSINEVITDNDGFVSGLINQLLELPARAIPTLSKQIADLTDPVQRQTYEYKQPVKSAVNYSKSKIPGLSKSLTPSVDTMGREIQKYGGKNTWFNVLLNPANVNTENISEAAKEVYKVYQATGDTTVMPRVAPYYVGTGENKIILTNEQREKYQKIAGQLVEKSVQQLTKNGAYTSLSNEDKVSILSDIVNYAYNVAQHETIGTELSNEYSKAYAFSKIININDYYLSKLEKFESDIDEEGNTVRGSKKIKVANYINSLPGLSDIEKAILIKSNNYSLKEYENDIINYVVNKNLTISEKEEILTRLGYKIKDGRVMTK